jgi:hypothetical protein
MLDFLGELTMDFNLNWGIFISIIGLLGLPTVYYFNFKNKKGKTVIDYLKYTWLLLFISPNLIRYSAFMSKYNSMNYNTFESIKHSFLSQTVWIIEWITLLILVVIFVLTMIEKYKTRDLIEIVE